MHGALKYQIHKIDLEVVGAMLEPSGVKLIEGYATLGEYDMIAIVEAPNDKTIAAASIAISSTGQ